MVLTGDEKSQMARLARVGARPRAKYQKGTDPCILLNIDVQTQMEMLGMEEVEFVAQPFAFLLR
jgi:hypothetical protein